MATRKHRKRSDERPRAQRPAVEAGTPIRGAAPGAGVRLPVKSWTVNLLLWLSSVGLLSLAFPPMRWAALAHVALAPMLVAIARAPGARVLVACSVLAGAVFYGAQMYWMSMVTWPAYVGVVLYCLMFWVAFAVLLRWTLRRTRLPMVLVAPVLWVSLEWARSWGLTGFPWLYLGHPQAANAVLLQSADLAGAYGLSALSAATAGLAADVVTRPFFLRYGRRVRVALGVRIACVAVAAAWTFFGIYGWQRLQPRAVIEGPLVVTVQSNVPQELKWVLPESPRAGDTDGAGERAGGAPEGETDPEAEPKPDTPDGADPGQGQEDIGYLQVSVLTAEALQEWPDADLVIWPETTVPAYLNAWYLKSRVLDAEQARRDPEWAAVLEADPAKFKAMVAEARQRQADARFYWEQTHRWPRERGAAVLVGAMSLDESGARRNSALLLKAGDATFEASGRYDKVHLVPFGEFIPFSESAPWLYALLKPFTPYGEEYNLTPGREVTVMSVGESWFAAPICFEDAFPDVCRRMVYRNGRKRADFLVNISNDGWFAGSIELEQHWDLSAFRAVENRVPVVRSVNTGISGFIDSCGRTVARVTDERGWPRSVKGIAGRRLVLDARESFYGRYGDVFAWVLSLGAVSIIIVSTFNPRRGTNEKESGS